MRIEVLQGLPGSGKSRYAEHAANGNGGIVVSADKFHLDANGDYVYKPENAAAAHAACLRSFTHFVQRSDLHHDDLLIVDNTNCRAIEAAPYMALAAAYGVAAEIVYFPCDVETSLRLNTHNVPFGTIMEMNRLLNTENFPPYWKRRLA